MPTGDLAQNAPPSSPQPQGSPRPDSGAGSASVRTMTAKSAAITARTNYVSPYRQAPASRSVSSPTAARANATQNSGSPNFKNIVDRFNSGRDEKIPVPTNRIPARAVVATTLPKERRTPASEARRASITNPNVKSRPGAAPARPRAQTRSSSAQDAYPSASNAKPAGKSQPQQRNGRVASTTEKEAPKPRPGRTLPAIQTNFDRDPFKGKDHLRPRSAVEGYSPSAASLADNEADSIDSPGPPRHHHLSHRRSRSNIETSGADLAAMALTQSDMRRGSNTSDYSSQASPRLGHSHHPLTANPAEGRDDSKTFAKRLEAKSSDMGRGSKKPVQTVKTTNLRVHAIPPPPKSPPLRSSRQRLPVAAGASTHASRQRMQNTIATSNGRSSRAGTSTPEDAKRKDPRRKIPEIGPVDFAARRARIQASYTKSMKEDNERRELEAQKALEAKKLRDEEEEQKTPQPEDTDGDLSPSQVLSDEPLPERPRTVSISESTEVEDFIRRGNIISLAPGSEDTRKMLEKLPDLLDESDRDEDSETRLEDPLKKGGKEFAEHILSGAKRASYSGSTMPGAWDMEYYSPPESPIREVSFHPSSVPEPPQPEQRASTPPPQPVELIPNFENTLTGYELVDSPGWQSPGETASPSFPDSWRNTLAPNDSVSVIVTPVTPAQETVFSQVADMLREGTSPLWSTSSDMDSSDAHTDKTIQSPIQIDYDRKARRESTATARPDSEMTIHEPVSVPSTPGGMIDIGFMPERSHTVEFPEDVDNQDGWETTCGETETEGETEVETETEAEGSVVGRAGDAEEFTSCSEAVESPHPTQGDQTDEWTDASEAEGSPGIDDDEYDPYNVYRYKVGQPDSPTTPRQPIELSIKLPPTPPPKDAPPLPLKNLHTPASANPTSPNADFSQAYFPDLGNESATLGLAIHTFPAHYDLRPANGQRPSSYHTEEFYSSANVQLQRNISYESPRTSIDQYSDHRPSIERPSIDRPSMDRPSMDRPSMDRLSMDRPSMDRPNTYHDGQSSSSSFYAETRPSSSFTQTCPPPTTAATSMTSISKPATEDEKRLKQRYYALKELLDTENAYFRDITIIEEIYKGSASACSAITPEDVKVIFGNSNDLVEFTRTFLEMLRGAVAPVYTLSRNASGLNSAAASIKDVDILNGAFPEVVITHEENEANDRKTNVGETVTKMLFALEKIYTEWVLHQPPAQARLKSLESNQAVSIWLAECQSCARDLTSAWDLGSLIIKPFQRVLKYHLILQNIQKATPPDHPDYESTDFAIKELCNLGVRLNNAVKRRDLVDKIVSKHESDFRHGVSKGLARSAFQVVQSLKMADGVVDDRYNRLFTSYNTHFMQVQLIARDFIIYVDDLAPSMNKLLDYTHTFREFGEVLPSNYSEVEAKWRRLDSAMKEISSSYMAEHKKRVRQHCIQPLEALLKLHESPQKIMYKRNKKAQDYARYRAVTDKGETPDNKLKGLAEEYVALNDTLIEELPRLFQLTKKLVEAALLNFVDLQAQYMSCWATKLKVTFIEMELPTHMSEIVDEFMADYLYNEDALRALSICNGSLKDTGANSLEITRSASSDIARPNPASRPKTAEVPRDRAVSLNNSSPTFDSILADERRHSGGSPKTQSPFSTTAPSLPLPPLLAPSSRNRTVSAALLPTTAAASAAGAPMQPQRSHTSARLPDSHRAAQTSYAGSIASSSSSSIHERQAPLSRAAAKAAVGLSSGGGGVTPLNLANNVRGRSPSPPPPSAAFSSAMPMEDDRDVDDSASIDFRRSRASSTTRQSRNVSRTPSQASTRRALMLTLAPNDKVMFVAASLYEFQMEVERREAGFPYLTYVQGELFDVIGVKGEIWLARNQDDPKGEIGWIWEKHFQKIPGSDDFTGNMP